MTRFDDEGLVTDDPVVAAMFLGEEMLLQYQAWEASETWSHWIPLRLLNSWSRPLELIRSGKMQILIPWPTVREAIQPVEGEGYVEDDCTYTNEPPRVFAEYQPDERHRKGSLFHKRVLNIVTTRAELRELVARIRS